MAGRLWGGREAWHRRAGGGAGCRGREPAVERAAVGLRQRLRVLYHEQRMQQVPGQLPARGGEVERVAVAERPIQLRLERVQHHVHLVDDADAGPPDAEQLDRARRLRVERRLVEHAVVEYAWREPHEAAHALAERVEVLGVLARVEQVEQLEQFEHEGLDRGGRRKHHRALLDRRVHLGQQLGRDRGSPVEREGPHGLVQRRRRERAAEHCERETEEGRRHDLGDELRAVAKKQRKHRRDDCGLTLAHEHLVAHGAAGSGARGQFGDERHLRRSEHHAPRELEDEDAGVEHGARSAHHTRARRRARRPVGHVRSAEAERASEGVRNDAHRCSGQRHAVGAAAKRAVEAGQRALQLPRDGAGARGEGGARNAQQDGGGARERLGCGGLAQERVERAQFHLASRAHEQLGQQVERHWPLAPGPLRERARAARRLGHAGGTLAREREQSGQFGFKGGTIVLEELVEAGHEPREHRLLPCDRCGRGRGGGGGVEAIEVRCTGLARRLRVEPCRVLGQARHHLARDDRARGRVTLNL
mmetsp:Transcript_16802/g.53342  ORF Transcript_16802/g.53342 Transcript_16802/m.53342 type:complete len:533 (-) Transcript_16802:3452-5050(-)